MEDSIDDRLTNIFAQVFNIEECVDISQMKMLDFDKWDSMAQLMLITAVQQEFGVSTSAEELEHLTSYSSVRLHVQKSLPQQPI